MCEMRGKERSIIHCLIWVHYSCSAARRSSPPVEDDFHWSLYAHQHSDTGGTKYHIQNMASGWITGHSITADISKAFLLIGLIRIADIPTRWESHVDRTLRTSATSCKGLH